MERRRVMFGIGLTELLFLSLMVIGPLVMVVILVLLIIWRDTRNRTP